MSSTGGHCSDAWLDPRASFVTPWKIGLGEVSCLHPTVPTPRAEPRAGDRDRSGIVAKFASFPMAAVRSAPTMIDGAAEPETVTVEVDGIPFVVLTWSPGPPAAGPLALCLHGYPDTARTWRHLGPFLAARGWRVAAPYTRGYAPTGVAPDGCYQLGALARDAVRLHELLGGDERSVLIGHDWGAETAPVAAASAPGHFRRLVSIGYAPAFLLRQFSSIAGARANAPLLARQLLRNWYMYFQLLPRISEASLPQLIPLLWSRWSPGYDAREDVAEVLAALAPPGHATAALRYYRALYSPWRRSLEYEPEQAHLYAVASAPLLYLQGDRDGCLLPALAVKAAAALPAGSEFELVRHAGHWPHLEQPEYINQRIAEFAEAP
jgi:pimeloyl-ACP methyl ester carboxylesterase